MGQKFQGRKSSGVSREIQGRKSLGGEKFNVENLWGVKISGGEKFKGENLYFLYLGGALFIDKIYFLPKREW